LSPEFPITISLVAVLAVVTLLLLIGKRKLSSKLSENFELVMAMPTFIGFY
jgi:hypothetical protein